MLLAQISDPHVNDARPAAAERLRRTIAFLLTLPQRPDAVIVTGDITDHGTPSEYQQARETLARLPMPVRVLAGNHDDRAHLRRAFGTQGEHAMADFIQFTWELGGYRLIALDSTIPNENGGLLCAERLAWLEARLAESPGAPTFVCVHHPPFATGMHVLDAIGLSGSEALAAIVARYPNVERVLSGHVHFTATARFAGTIAMTAPSTSMTIDHDLTTPERVFMLDGAPPALLLHQCVEKRGVLSSELVVADRGIALEIHDGRDWHAPTPRA